MSKEQKVINYYVLCNKLKNVIVLVGKIGMLKERE